jgi:hypothetical protein
MDQLEAMAPLRNSDIKGFERYSDLVRFSVVKLQADGRDAELGEGTLHSFLVKKLTDRQVESYSRWLGEKKRERSVLNIRDWLKEEVRIRVEAVEMVHGVVDKDDGKRAEGSGGRGRLGGAMVDHILVVVLAAGWLTSSLVHRVQETMRCGRVKSFRD